MKKMRKQKRPFHVMIIPTLGCPSKCSYCWSSEVGSPRMTIETVGEIVEWLRDFRRLRTIFAEKGSPTKAFRIYLDGFG